MIKFTKVLEFAFFLAVLTLLLVLLVPFGWFGSFSSSAGYYIKGFPLVYWRSTPLNPGLNSINLILDIPFWWVVAIAIMNLNEQRAHNKNKSVRSLASSTFWFIVVVLIIFAVFG